MAPRPRRQSAERAAEDAALSGPERPSRSQRKREALALQRLGVTLTGLTAAQLARLELPEPLLEAVQLAQRLRSRAALARQRQYIGRLMRETDTIPIERALLALNVKLTG
ncbi:MAG TPA: ribosome biogenesis factor YjgA [Steroidobacteraceae bacterium]|nr:ribosome biogenesis factor YjgA [Steroidobacteraceae bacterium]